MPPAVHDHMEIEDDIANDEAVEAAVVSHIAGTHTLEQWDLLCEDLPDWKMRVATRYRKLESGLSRYSAGAIADRGRQRRFENGRDAKAWRDRQVVIRAAMIARMSTILVALHEVKQLARDEYNAKSQLRTTQKELKRQLHTSRKGLSWAYARLIELGDEQGAKELKERMSGSGVKLKTPEKPTLVDTGGDIH